MITSGALTTLRSLGFMALLCSGLATHAQDQAPAGNIPRYTIENCVNSFSMADTVRTAVGYQYWFADKNFADGKTLKLSVVAPNSATHPPHAHSEDEFFFILEGRAECILAGKTKTVGPNTSFYCPSNVEHGIRNAGKTELKYLVIKKYEKK